MALGGGTWLVQNKIIGGSYINFVSKPVATATILDRGIIAFAFDMPWGKDNEIFEVIETDVIRNSLEIFGFDYSDDNMKGIIDIFKNATKLYCYRLNTGGTKASGAYATAKYTGTRGNDIKVVIADDIDVEDNKIVTLYVGNTEVFSQSVASANDLADNAFVEWKKSATLEVTAGVNLTGGTDGTVEASNHQTFLDKLESYPDVNAIGYAGTDNNIKALYSAFVKNMRDKVGIKLQAVVHNYNADHEGVVNVKNSADLVYWATGVIGGTDVNKSATNKRYDGNFEMTADYTQSQLEKCIKNGEWTLHRVGDELRVLEDINSLVTESVDKNYIFKDNQTIRIIDAIATAVATVFNNKYLGKVPNDVDGRDSLWADIVKIHNDLQNIRALENFKPEDVIVEQGDTKKAVLVNESITVVNTMVRLYMTVVVG